MTRCRNALIHYLNCYWNSSVADYYVGPENVSSYFEGCTFAGKANNAKNIYKGFNGTTNYCKFVNCTGNLPSNSGTVNAPGYAYDDLSAAEAKNYVTNSTCGAGATLSVTESGVVTSSCDGGDTPVDPPVGPVSGDCCIDLGLGEEPTLTNGGIPSDFGQVSIAYAFNHTSSAWEQGYLNMGSNADYITFDFSAYATTITAASFDVTIPNWAEGKNTIAYHWNSESNKKYNISGPAKETVQLTAPTNAKSFTIQRSAGTGTRIAQVCLTIAGSTTNLMNVQRNKVQCTKVIRNGQIVIERNGTTYTLTGQPVGR